MYTIREGVFETNSSSSHCLVFNPNYSNIMQINTYNFEFDNVDSDNMIHVETKFYHDDYSYLETPQQKLEYLVTQILNYSAIFDDFDYILPEQAYLNHKFQELNNYIHEKTQYAGIVIDNNITKENCHIDHESCVEDYSKILKQVENNETGESEEVSLFDYLFNNNYYIYLDWI